jgi:imidazolonepropionase-like amidohydrolase
MLGREREQGTVEVGKLAVLVILNANPLADIKNVRRIHRVLKSGIFYDPAELLQPIK